MTDAEIIATATDIAFRLDRAADDLQIVADAITKLGLADMTSAYNAIQQYRAAAVQWRIVVSQAAKPRPNEFPS